MASTFKLEIITPTSYEDLGEVEYLRAPGVDGLFGVERGHTKAVIALACGEIKVVKDSKPQFYATSGGYAEIQPDKVQLLVETAEKAGEIDVPRAQRALERARAKLSEVSEEAEREQAERALERALNRIRVAQRKS